MRIGIAFPYPLRITSKTTAEGIRAILEFVFEFSSSAHSGAKNQQQPGTGYQYKM